MKQKCTINWILGLKIVDSRPNDKNDISIVYVICDKH